MNSFDKVREAYYHHMEQGINKLDLALAYLQLHRDNPGLHPDNHRDPEGGYSGWHVLLVEDIKRKFSTAPDVFHYPFWIGALVDHALIQLEEFHSSDEDELMSTKVGWLQQWFDDLMIEETGAETRDIERADTYLSDLLMFHDGAPEGVFAALAAASEAIHWLNQQV